MKKNLLILIVLFWSFLLKAQTVTDTFNYSGAIVQWTVPPGINAVRIVAKGAEGVTRFNASDSAGKGASMQGDFTLTPGSVLKLLVGQHPVRNDYSYGGGGTFVTDLQNNPYIVAGGGGGSGTIDAPQKDGQTGTSGGNGGGTSMAGAGGTNGNGGEAGNLSGGGGGLLTDGEDASDGGQAFVNGGAGGSSNSSGFGGGGGYFGGGGGGGGGYSGGGGGGIIHDEPTAGVGGGGGSFNAGTNQSNTAGANTGDGVVTITYTNSISCTAPATLCPGSNVSISYIANGTYNSGNTFTAQLSDAAGNFSNSVNIGTLSATASGTINAVVPSNTSAGNGYRIRVVSDMPVVTGSDNGTDITINAPPQPVITPGGQVVLCNGSSITLTSNAPSGNQWYLDGNPIKDATDPSYVATEPREYSVVFTSGTCTSPPSEIVTVIANPIPDVVATPSSQTICSGTASSIALTGNVTETGFSWTVVQVGVSGASPGGGSSIAQTLTATGTTAGSATYTITPAANGCTGTPVTATVTVNPAPTVTLNAGTISCYGGLTTITVHAGSGTNPCKYKLSGGLSFQVLNTFIVGAGTYTVTVQDAKGCTKTSAPIIITQPPAISISLSAGTINCYGGTTSLTITASGGTPGYTYSLNGCAFQGSNTFTASATTCAVTVKDSKGCIAAKSVNISQPPLLTTSLSAKTNVSCYGGSSGSITTKATGGTQPYTYKINTASSYQGSSTFNNLTAATYSVTVKDKNGCTAVVTGIAITQPSALTLTLVQKINVSCLNGSNGSIKVSAGGGTSPYKYSLNSGSYGTSGTFSSLKAGSYTVNTKDANSCTKSISVVINNGTGHCNGLSVTDGKISDAAITEETLFRAVISPNPSEAEFTLTLSGNSNEPVEVRVIDMYGRTVHYARGSANQSYKFGQRFAAGVYVVEMLQGKNVKTLKIIKGN